MAVALIRHIFRLLIVGVILSSLCLIFALFLDGHTILGDTLFVRMARYTVEILLVVGIGCMPFVNTLFYCTIIGHHIFSKEQMSERRIMRISILYFIYIFFVCFYVFLVLKAEGKS